MAKTKGKPKAKVNPSAPASQIAPRGAETSTADNSYMFHNRTKSARAGLIFPVNTVRKNLQEGKYADKIGIGAAVYMSAVLEYLTAELIEICGEASAANKRKRINPRHVMLAVRTDDEFGELLKGVTIASAGVPVNIQQALLPKPTTKRRPKSGRVNGEPVPTAAPGHGGDDSIEGEGGEEEEDSDE